MSEAVSHKVLEHWFLQYGCTIFGGYVRDKLLGIIPQDIDIKVDSEFQLDNVVKKFKMRLKRFQEIKKQSYRQVYMDFWQIS